MVLPQPLSPTIPTISPRGTVRSTCASARINLRDSSGLVAHMEPGSCLHSFRLQLKTSLLSTFESWLTLGLGSHHFWSSKSDFRVINQPARRGAGFAFIPVFKIEVPRHIARAVRERPCRGGSCRQLGLSVPSGSWWCRDLELPSALAPLD